jgi:hypothetical protein
MTTYFSLPHFIAPGASFAVISREHPVLSAPLHKQQVLRLAALAQDDNS